MQSKNSSSISRVKNNIIEIDYNNTLSFFNNRAKKINEKNPYSVTMYQDENPSLVEERNKKEIEKLLPLLKLTEKSSVLDVACGIGRWSDAITENITSYYGIDFSRDLVNIAIERNKYNNRSFFVGNVIDVNIIVERNKIKNIDRLLLMGIMIYLNDEDVQLLARNILKIVDKGVVICIREPVAVSERLTLKNFYSLELKSNYNAIYRTINEIKKLFLNIFIENGFTITSEGVLFTNTLNNRKETEQYYFILER